MLHYFHGPDTYAARQAITEIAVEGKSRLRWLDKEDLQQSSLRTLTEQGSGLFGSHLFVLRDPSLLPTSMQDSIVEDLAYVHGELVLWDRTKSDKRSKLWRELRSQAREFPLPSDALLLSWLIELVQEEEGIITPEAARFMIEQLGKDRWRLQSELSRLLLLEKNITIEIVSAQITVPVRAEIFSALNAVAQHDRRQALVAIEALLAAGSSEFYILSMLAYQFRTMLMISQGLAEGASETTIARSFGIHPYVVQKTIPLVRQVPSDTILAALTRISACDFSIKQGVADARTALLMLVINLATPVNQTVRT